MGRLAGIACVGYPHVETIRVVSAETEWTIAAGTGDIDDSGVSRPDTAGFRILGVNFPDPAHKFMADDRGISGRQAPFLNMDIGSAHPLAMRSSEAIPRGGVPTG